MADETTLLKNIKALEGKLLAAIRGPALAFLTKVTGTRATAQPVIRHRAPDGQSVVQSPTIDAPLLTLGGGGFELSLSFEAADTILSLPLEADHTNYYESGKTSEPASDRRHDRGLAVSVPFGWKSTTKAQAGETYLGYPKAGAGNVLDVSIRFKKLEAKLEIRGDGGIKIGINATRGAARLNDTVSIHPALATWMGNVQTSLSALFQPVAPIVGSTIGTISSASTLVEVE